MTKTIAMRLMLTAVLLFFVYLETGVATAIFAILVAAYVELNELGQKDKS